MKGDVEQLTSSLAAVNLVCETRLHSNVVGTIFTYLPSKLIVNKKNQKHSFFRRLRRRRKRRNRKATQPLINSSSKFTAMPAMKLNVP